MGIFETILGFAASEWFFDALNDLVRYFNRLSVTQWAVVAASAVGFGFLCMKGNAIHR